MEEFKSAGWEVLRDAKGVGVTFSRSSGPGGQVSFVFVFLYTSWCFGKLILGIGFFGVLECE